MWPTIISRINNDRATSHASGEAIQGGARRVEHYILVFAQSWFSPGFFVLICSNSGFPGKFAPHFHAPVPRPLSKRSWKKINSFDRQMCKILFMFHLFLCHSLHGWRAEISFQADQCSNLEQFHQTAHLLTGFILLPDGQ